jgi:hypothetical protein
LVWPPFLLVHRPLQKLRIWAGFWIWGPSRMAPWEDVRGSSKISWMNNMVKVVVGTPGRSSGEGNLVVSGEDPYEEDIEESAPFPHCPQ